MQELQKKEAVKKKILIVGRPNVGKSVLFGALTGRYATVSNYPGTTVEVARGKVAIGELAYEVIDTPGMYSLSPITEEERVARKIIFDEAPDIVVHVVDAKNIERMLTLTLELRETELPLILLLNMMDEADRAGVHLDSEQLEKELALPVIKAVCTSGAGIEELKERIRERTA